VAGGKSPSGHRATFVWAQRFGALHLTRAPTVTVSFVGLCRTIAHRSSKSRYPVVRQYDHADCGPAALLSVLKFWGGDASLVHIRELAHTDAQGSTMLSLVRAATALGFRARGASGDLDDLAREQMPCIAHVVLPEGLHHYLVIYKIEARGLLVGDPGRGRYRLSRDAFTALWVSRAVILLTPERPLCHAPARHWISWVASHFREETTWLSQSIFLGVVYTGLWLLTSLFVKRLVDHFIPDRNIRGVLLTAAALAVLQGLRAGAGYVRQRFLIALSARTNVRMAQGFLQHVFRLPARFFDTHRRGDIMARVNDSVQIQAAVVRIIGVTVIDALIILGTIGATFLVAPSLGWLALTAVPLYAVLLISVTRPLRSAQNEVARRHAEVESMYVDSLAGIDDIRTFGVEGTFAAAAEHRYRAFQDRTASLGQLQARASLGAEIGGGLLVIATLAAGAVAVVHGSLQLGAMLAAYSLLAGALPSVNRLIDANVAIQSASIAAMRLMDLLLVEPERVDGAGVPFALREAVFLDAVRFSWPRGGVLFADITMTIPRGRITALCGPSGSGKSTIVKLLQRSYAVTGGAIRVGDTPADAIELGSYRANVAVVRESTKIFNLSLRDNIVLGRAGHEGAALLERIATLGFEPFIARFPAGLDTLLGEDARQLSSGERQVVGVLRALITEPALLVVDEGVNAVDAEMADIAHRALRWYSVEHAVLLISHNPRTVEIADRSYLLRDGRAIDIGPAPRAPHTSPAWAADGMATRTDVAERQPLVLALEN
jgi:ABC-type bacteriocin/lantibiotic exporter with double-glycine peptidase domain